MYCIDLNSDLGESFGSYKIGMDELVIGHVSSINAACGFHASDPQVMEKTVAMAKAHNIRIGAHPGLPDLVGFGRRTMEVSFEETKAMVLYQIGALAAFCKVQGVELQHVKPHGALYNMAAQDKRLAEAICEAIAEYDSNLIVMGLAGSEMIVTAKEKGLKVACEIFSDRAYEEDGSLVNRRKEGAVIHDEEVAIYRMVRAVKEGKIEAITGKLIDVDAQSICVHGDGEKAVKFTQRIRAALEAEGVKICSLSEVLK
ncbi:MAG: 5-oxoprolinase subunit PxpA [Eubacteriales bacterium]